MGNLVISPRQRKDLDYVRPNGQVVPFGSKDYMSLLKGFSDAVASGRIQHSQLPETFRLNISPNVAQKRQQFAKEVAEEKERYANSPTGRAMNALGVATAGSFAVPLLDVAAGADLIKDGINFVRNSIKKGQKAIKKGQDATEPIRARIMRPDPSKRFVQPSMPKYLINKAGIRPFIGYEVADQIINHVNDSEETYLEPSMDYSDPKL